MKFFDFFSSFKSIFKKGKFKDNFLAEKSIVKEPENLEKLTSQEFEVCNYIQELLVSKGLGIEYLRFSKRSLGHVAVCYIHNVVKFKLGKEKFFIIPKELVKKISLSRNKVSPCSQKEGKDRVRYKFNKIVDLAPLEDYICSEYGKVKKEADDYMKASEENYEHAMRLIDGMVKL